jgi:hypothetical protein
MLTRRVPENNLIGRASRAGIHPQSPQCADDPDLKEKMASSHYLH